jgi:hypothetical protein
MTGDVTDPLSLTGKVMRVPEDLLALSRDTDIPLADSPESLDHDLATGTNREKIDPDHSVDKPTLSSTEQNGEQ